MAPKREVEQCRILLKAVLVAFDFRTFATALHNLFMFGEVFERDLDATISKPDLAKLFEHLEGVISVSKRVD